MTTLLLDLDLEAPPRVAIALEDHERIRAVVWRGDEPIGQIAFAAAGDVSPERLLTEARRQLGDPPKRALPVVDAVRLPMVTVAVCTRDRPEDLERCLTALLAQSEAPPHEILVVDNAPPNGRTRELVARFPSVRYLVEELRGLGFARNRALREARGEILAWADDDWLLADGWLRAIATMFALNADVGVCGGPVVPAELETEAQELFELRGGFTQGFRPHVYGPQAPEDWRSRHWPMLAGSLFSPVAVRVQPLRRLGGFDEALGAGTPATGGDDHDIVYRLLVAGHRLAFEPSALVRHRHRRDLPALRRQLDGWGCGTVAFITKSGRGGRRERWQAVLATGWLFAHHLRRMLASARPGSRRSFPTSLVLVELAGCVRGLWAYRRSERHVRRLRSENL